VSEDGGSARRIDTPRLRPRLRIPNPWAALAGMPRDVWMLCAATLVNRAGTMALLFLVLYLTERGWSAREAGWVVSVFGIGSLVAAPLGGRLCDRIGARRVVLGSLALAGVFLIVYPFATGRIAVYGLTLLWSLSGEAFRPASYTLVSHAAPAAQQRPAFAALRMSINLGASVGPALGGFLARVWMPALFLVDGVTSIAAAVVLWWSGRRRRGSPDAAVAGAGHPAHPSTSRFGLLADSRIVRLLAGMLLLTTVFFQIMSALPLDLVRGQGMSEAELGLLFGLNALLVVLFEVPLSVRLGTWPASRAMAIGALLIAAGVGATAFAHDFATAAVTVVVWSLGEMVLFPTASAYVSEITTPARRGEAMGLYTAAFGAGFILAPLLGTWALERWGADRMWFGAFVAGCIAAASLARLHTAKNELLRR
jgi:predicted MFS family arabinose efflux permease